LLFPLSYTLSLFFSKKALRGASLLLSPFWAELKALFSVRTLALPAGKKTTFVQVLSRYFRENFLQGGLSLSTTLLLPLLFPRIPRARKYFSS